MDTKRSCAKCGAPFQLNDDGTSQHLTEDGDIDYDRDADHVAYCLDDEED